MNTLTDTKLLNVIVADQSQVYLEALVHRVQVCKDIQLIASCSTSLELLSILPLADVDVLVIDTAIFGRASIRAIKEIKTTYPCVRIIALSIEESTHSRDKLLAAGIDMHISKWSDTSGLMDLIKAV